MKNFLSLEKAAYVLIGLMVVASLVLGGCGKETPAPQPVEVSDPAPDEAPAPAPSPVTSMESMMEAHMSAFKDGNYFHEGAYQNPAGDDSITVQLKVENDRVTGVSIGLRGNDPTSKNFQQLFADGIGGLVVGKSLDAIGPVGAVNGSSLTPLAFNRALLAIKAEARS